MKASVAQPGIAATNTPTREELTTYMFLVHQVVGRLLRRLPPNVLRDDLTAAGTFGLVDALRKSSDRGPAFEWYARIRIRGAVVDELRAQDWLTRRARTRIERAQARGEAGAVSVIGFDDLPESQAQGFCDESAASPQEQVEHRLNRVALERAVAQLPEREGNIVAWHYFDGVPFKTIAVRLGVSEPRVSQLHSRAMARLREAMAEFGAEAA
ncbi:MAG TPA: sigma-70 family RNA polymerase sigma factor [Polyangiaceae bacterium]|nr:sigma-70 family RNA polymerase sigma factor [Polyangiaceae bacterium]